MDKKHIAVGGALVIGAGLTLAGATGWGRPAPVAAAVVTTTGNEAPASGAMFDNGWNIADYGEAGSAILILTTYRPLASYLGEPISTFDGGRQMFRNGGLTYNPNNPAGWRVELMNAGRFEQEIEGYTPKPGSAPHPAVRDWLLSQQEIGFDLGRVVGQIISDPICDRLGQCKQFTDKQLFLFSRTAASGDQVQRAPLGLWLTHPGIRDQAVAAAAAQEVSDRRLDPLIIAGGAVFVLTLLILLFRGRQRPPAFT